MVKPDTRLEDRDRQTAPPEPGPPAVWTRRRRWELLAFLELAGLCGLAITQPLLDVGEQPTERSHVLVVVPDDGGERLRRTAAEEAEVTARDLPAIDVVEALDPERDWTAISSGGE